MKILVVLSAGLVKKRFFRLEKVIELKRESMRELEFYQAILENFPNLKAVVPKCFGVYYRTSDNIAVIFMDPLAPLGLEKKRIGLPVIEINSFIESVSYNDIRNFSGISVDYSKPFARIFHLRYGCKYALSEIRLGFPAVVTDEGSTAIALLGDDIFAQRYSRICQS